MKLYTRTGDAGSTSLVGGVRIAKNSVRVEAYGTVDELNSAIGLLQAHTSMIETGEEVTLSAINTMLASVSNLMFDIGAYLSTPPGKSSGCGVGERHIEALEKAIDELDAATPEQRTFILPGGCVAACHAHMARTICRRAERRVLDLCDTGEEVDPLILAWFNRLSDWLFILARHLNHLVGVADIPWTKQS